MDLTAAERCALEILQERSSVAFRQRLDQGDVLPIDPLLCRLAP